MFIFKYLGPAGAARVLEHDDSLSIRFGLPRSYNDPYELFLQPSTPLASEELRAFFEFFFGRVVQAPVSCFSVRPECVPMWAHYAQEGTGIVLGFDEDALATEFSLAYFTDVEYSDAPATIDSDLIDWTFTTGKRRHAIRLLAHAHRAAFFIKRLEWQYERERRLVVATDEVSDVGGILLAPIAPTALRFLILGTQIAPDLRNHCEQFAARHGIPLLEFFVGRKHYEPIFRRSGSRPLRWTGTEFEELTTACSACSEPADDIDPTGLCVWCRISEGARRAAAKKSMLAATLYFGLDRGLPLEFEGLNPKGRDAERWIAEAPRRQAEAMARDAALLLELFAVMKKSGLLDSPVPEGDSGKHSV